MAKRRQKIRLKKKFKRAKNLKLDLRNDIVQYLVDLRYCTTPEPDKLLLELLHSGHKGFHEMRSKELISTFEWHYNNVRLINSSNFHAHVLSPDDFDRVYRGSRYGRWEPGTNHLQLHSARKETQDEFILRGDSLVSRILEAIIGLEAEDKRKEQERKPVPPFSPSEIDM